MNKKKEYRQYGVYGLIIQDDKILLIKKFGGPYNGKLDLPGGTIEFREKPEETLKRELMEEVGIELKNYQLFDANSVYFDWNYNDDTIVEVHHTGIFYKVLEFDNEIKKDVEVDSVNDDSLGAEWFDISTLTKNQLSSIALLELEKLGYNINS